MIAITVNNVSKDFKSVEGQGDMNLHINNQEFCALVEPTGVGTFVFCEFAGYERAFQVAKSNATKVRDTIRLSISQVGILLFDKKTEEGIGDR